jgi:hypothetical protein
MESYKVLTEKEAKKIIRQSRAKELRRSSVKYLIDQGASTLSEIMYGITSNYVIRKSNNYFIEFHISRRDMKDVLNGLRSDGYVEFIGGHKWKATQSGIDEIERVDRV